MRGLGLFHQYGGMIKVQKNISSKRNSILKISDRFCFDLKMSILVSNSNLFNSQCNQTIWHNCPSSWKWRTDSKFCSGQILCIDEKEMMWRFHVDILNIIEHGVSVRVIQKFYPKGDQIYHIKCMIRSNLKEELAHVKMLWLSSN